MGNEKSNRKRNKKKEKKNSVLPKTQQSFRHQDFQAIDHNDYRARIIVI